MEDAHISISPLSDKKSSLFAVFDGHGGNPITKLKELKWPHSFKDTLFNNFKPILTLRKDIMNLP